MLTEREMDTKVCSKCREVKLLEEFNKKRSSKDGHQSNCKACAKEYTVKYRADNPEKIKKTRVEYYAANSEKRKEYQSEYRASNPDYQAKWCAANSEKKKEYDAEWCAANPEKCRARTSNRRAAKLEAIPSWLTEEDYKAMEDIGKEADRLTRETGIKYEVDHIHPLQGKLICGLQCPTNLQILTKSQNCSKGNRFTSYVESEI